MMKTTIPLVISAAGFLTTILVNILSLMGHDLTTAQQTKIGSIIAATISLILLLRGIYAHRNMKKVLISQNKTLAEENNQLLSTQEGTKI